jgi:2-dehydro-3-deoxygalactonokinase
VGQPGLVAVDWGTSSLRGALLDQNGGVLKEKSAPLGILNVPGGDFAAVFNAQFSDWMRPAGSLCLMSGMVGSRQGWQEAPYAACPAGLDPVQMLRELIEPGATVSPSSRASVSTATACPT